MSGFTLISVHLSLTMLFRLGYVNVKNRQRKVRITLILSVNLLVQKKQMVYTYLKSHLYEQH